MWSPTYQQGAYLHFTKHPRAFVDLQYANMPLYQLVTVFFKQFIRNFYVISGHMDRRGCSNCTSTQTKWRLVDGSGIHASSFLFRNGSMEYRLTNIRRVWVTLSGGELFKMCINVEIRRILYDIIDIFPNIIQNASSKKRSSQAKSWYFSIVFQNIYGFVS